MAARSRDTKEGGSLSQVSFFDYYGFAVYKADSELSQEDCRSHEYKILSDKDSANSREFWTKMLGSWEQNQMMSPKLLKQYIRKGVPDNLRGQVWNKLIGGHSIRSISTFDYQTTLAEIRQLLVDLGVSEYEGSNCISRLGMIVGSLQEGNKENAIYSPETAIMTRQWKAILYKKISVFRQIMLDVDRSFPSHKMFIDKTSDGKEGRAALFRVLAVYSLYNPEVAYCQGMSYIAGMFLMNMDEEDSFWCLVSMFERPKYLAGYFHDSLDKIQSHAAVFDRLMQQRQMKLHKHLEALGVSSLMYLTPWFMVLFTSIPCWDTVLTIWDLLLLEGMSVIFQVALAVLDVLSEEILSLSEMSHVLPLLLRPPANLTSREVLVPAIWKVKQIQKWEIDSIQAVLDEENEKQLVKRTKRRSNDHDIGNRRKKQRTSSTQDASEPSLIQRVIGLFNSSVILQDEPVMPQPSNTTNTTDIEMTTFSMVSSQSPGVTLGMCCSMAACNSNMAQPMDSSKKTVSRFMRHPRSATKRTGTRNHVQRGGRLAKEGSLSSPVRRSPRLVGRRTPLGVKHNSPSRLVRSSAKNHHAFKVFNTPTPLRRSQVRPLYRSYPPTLSSPQLTVLSPDFVISPDVELVAFNVKENRLDFSQP